MITYKYNKFGANGLFAGEVDSKPKYNLGWLK